MLTRFRPFHDLARFERDFFRRPVTDAERANWRPAVDIEETEEAVVLTADLPGVDEKDIEITVHEGVLLLSGKRESVVDEETGTSLYRERTHGSFFRRFRLGRKVDAEQIAATYRNGVLTVTLPKREDAKPKQIPVTTN